MITSRSRCVTIWQDHLIDPYYLFQSMAASLARTTRPWTEYWKQKSGSKGVRAWKFWNLLFQFWPIPYLDIQSGMSYCWSLFLKEYGNSNALKIGGQLIQQLQSTKVWMWAAPWCRHLLHPQSNHISSNLDDYAWRYRSWLGNYVSWFCFLVFSSSQHPSVISGLLSLTRSKMAQSHSLASMYVCC